jgi:YVTN family beta-propeller protein
MTEVSGIPPMITLPVGRQPAGLAVTPDGRHLYVTLNFDESSDFVVVDTLTNTVVTKHPGTGLRGGVGVAPDGWHVYALDSVGEVSVIDTVSSTVVAGISVGHYVRPRLDTIAINTCLACALWRSDAAGHRICGVGWSRRWPAPSL